MTYSNGSIACATGAKLFRWLVVPVSEEAHRVVGPRSLAFEDRGYHDPNSRWVQVWIFRPGIARNPASASFPSPGGRT